MKLETKSLCETFSLCLAAFIYLALDMVMKLVVNCIEEFNPHYKAQ